MRSLAAVRRIVGCAALAVCASCDGIFDPDCSLEARASIAVTVLDNETGEGIAAGATLVQTSDGYADSVSFSAAPPQPAGAALIVWSASERPGTYDVTVHRPGYAPWTRTDVRVTKGRCHVRTVWLSARLDPIV